MTAAVLGTGLMGAPFVRSSQVINGLRDLVETHDGADLDPSACFLWLKMRQKT